jgi:hypothetical protein
VPPCFATALDANAPIRLVDVLRRNSKFRAGPIEWRFFKALGERKRKTGASL